MGEALLTHKLVGERLELAAGGSWTAPHAGDLEAAITIDPGTEALRKSGAGDTQWGIRAASG